MFGDLLYSLRVLKYTSTLKPIGEFMPNWCHNRVSFYSDNEQDINKLYEIFNSENVFEKILPSPDWKNTPNDKGQLSKNFQMARMMTAGMIGTTPTGVQNGM